MYFTETIIGSTNIHPPKFCDRQQGEDEINVYIETNLHLRWNDRFCHNSECLKSLKIVCLK